MNEVSSFHQGLTRILLIGSFVVFAAGAAVPAFDNVWGMSEEEGLRWIAANSGKWAFSSNFFILSLILCITGLAIFNQFFQSRGAQPLAKIAFYTYLIGAIFWILTMGFRLSIGPWAAQIFSETGSLPDSFTPLSLLESAFYDIFIISTFLASSVYGLALLKSPQFVNGPGWFAVGYGLFWAVSHAISEGPIPIMVLVVPLILGLSPFPDLLHANNKAI